MEELSYQVIRSGRRTVAIQITGDGQVLVRCPYRMPASQIEGFVESKRSWIEKHIRRQTMDAALLSDDEINRLRSVGQEVFLRRVTCFAPLVGVQWNRISVRFQKTRWGSCTECGNLSFNGLLLLAPPEILDYIVVHELCHRREMNHSARFWAEVDRVYPDYRSARKWLRENGPALVARLGRN